MTTIDRTWRRRKRERPSEILAAAQIEFRRGSFDGVTMKEIARRAGVSKGTIYLYFASKTDLFAAMALRRDQSVSRPGEGAPPVSGRPDDLRCAR